MKYVVAIFLVLLCSNSVLATDYDGWKRNSTYVAMRDDVRLAVEYYRPTRSGVLHKTPLPVVWRFTPYARMSLDTYGKVPAAEALRQGGAANNGPDTLRTLLQAGYVVADVDMRGFGASFGSNDGWMGPQDALDAHDITEWFAAQNWSTKSVGMTGMSYLGGVQYLAMSEASPHLKAIFPGMSQFDHYGCFYLNGVYRQDIGPLWRSIRLGIDFPRKDQPGSVAPVATDGDSNLLQEAVLDHYWNRDAGELMAQMRYRDSVDELTGRAMNIDRSFWHRLEAANRSGVAVYHWTGWYDHSGKHQLLAFANLKVPQKINIGPYFHSEEFGVDILEEQLRWFDCWLKGIDNGIMKEPLIRYFVAGEDPENGWKTAHSWPLAHEQRQRWFFAAGRSGSVSSVNDGKLTRNPVELAAGQDEYLINYDLALAGLGYVDRNNGVFRPQCAGELDVPEECYAGSGFPDLSESYDAKALTYTSGPLAQGLTVTGHPVVRFWASASEGDADFFVVLEEVEASGRSNYVSYYAIKGSHRTLNKAPYDNLGLPWPGNYRADVTPMTTEPTEIALSLNPVANLFEKGNRIRVTIAGADRLGGTPYRKSGPTMTIYRGGDYPSLLDLPVIE
jgi:uncharacterized protein